MSFPESDVGACMCSYYIKSLQACLHVYVFVLYKEFASLSSYECVCPKPVKYFKLLSSTEQTRTCLDRPYSVETGFLTFTFY